MHGLSTKISPRGMYPMLVTFVVKTFLVSKDLPNEESYELAQNPSGRGDRRSSILNTDNSDLQFYLCFIIHQGKRRIPFLFKMGGFKSIKPFLIARQVPFPAFLFRQQAS